MDESLVMIALIAAFVLGYTLIALYLERRWGVDPSRMTPAAEYGRGVSAVWMLLRDTLACLPMAYVLGVQAEGLLLWQAMAIAAVCVCVLGIVRFLSLFVSVRHGAACLADVAAEEIGEPMKKIAPLMTLAAVIPALAMLIRLNVFSVLRVSPGTEIPVFGAAVYALALLALMQVMIPSDLEAKELLSEGEMAALSMGGMLIAGLACVVVMLPGSRSYALHLPAAQSPMWEYLYLLPCLFAAERLMRLGCAALVRLFGRNLPVRKPNPYAQKAACCAVIVFSCALAYVGCEAVLPASALFAALLVLTSLICGFLWFARIGRSIF